MKNKYALEAISKKTCIKKFCDIEGLKCSHVIFFKLLVVFELDSLSFNYF